MSGSITIVGHGRLGRYVANKLKTDVHVAKRGEPIPSSDVTWLLVPDTQIAEVARSVPPGGVVLHASGALPHHILRPHPTAAVLHPVMTFSDTLEPAVVPATVSGDDDAVTAAFELAQKLGWQTTRFEGDRALYHAACVIAGNFATALMAVASQVATEAGVPGQDTDVIGLLAPLAIRSIENAALRGPAAALTGPVTRNDIVTIERHRAALRALEPELLGVYNPLTAVCRQLVSGPETPSQ